MAHSIESLLQHAGTPSSLPEVVIRLNELIEDPKSSAAEIGHIIEQDPALTASLLKIVNSPYYGFPSSIDSISRAITVIGIRDLRDLVLATSTVSAFSELESKSATVKRFWQHSLYCALISRMLAEQKKEVHTEKFFVAGLLHDIGILILHQAAPREYNEALRRSQEERQVIYKAEKEVIGFTHAEIGASLARKWKLPANLVETIAYHHTPQMASLRPVQVAIIHIADFLANSMNEGSSITGSVPPLDPKCWEIAELTLDSVKSTLFDVSEQFSQIYEFLIPRSMAA